MSIRGAVTVFDTFTPSAFTSAGSCDDASVSRIWVRIRSVFGSVFTSKFTTICRFPAAEFTEYM